MKQVHVRLLGGFSVEVDGQEVDIPTKKAGALLGFLTVEGKRTRSRARLSDLLWSRSGTDQGRQSLRQALFTIKKVIPGGLDPFLIDGDEIGIDTEVVSSDLEQFHEAIEAEDLDRAGELYQGVLLDGLDVDEPPFDQWLAARRTLLRETVINMFSQSIAGLNKQGDDVGAIRAAHALLELDPLHEETHRQLMRIFRKQGRLNEALKQYRDLENELKIQLRVDPHPDTQQLYEELLSGRRSGSAEEEKRRVLIVEDSELQRKLLSQIMLNEGWEVVSVDNGPDALIELGRVPCDLVLLDLNLPMLDGLNILQSAKRSNVDAPIIVISAEPPEEVEAKSLALGADDFIRKPVSRDALLQRLEKTLRS